MHPFFTWMISVSYVITIVKIHNNKSFERDKCQSRMNMMTVDEALPGVGAIFPKKKKKKKKKKICLNCPLEVIFKLYMFPSFPQN